MKQSFLSCLFSAACALAFCLTTGGAARADIVVFNTRADFNAAAPGLPVETFESGLVAAGAVTLCPSPLSSASGSPCFTPGGLLPGVVFSASPGLALLGAGVAGNTSRVLGPNSFFDSLDLTFADTFAVGFDVFSGPAAGVLVVRVFDPANNLLGSFQGFIPVTGEFFGVLSTTVRIGRINIASQSGVVGQLVDNVAFGAAAQTALIPEPATMILLGTGLAGVAAKVRRRRKE